MNQNNHHYSDDFFRSRPHKEELWRFIEQPLLDTPELQVPIAEEKTVHHEQPKAEAKFHIPHKKQESVTFLHIPHRVTASRLSRKARLTGSLGDPLSPHSNLTAAPVKQMHIKHSESIALAPPAKTTRQIETNNTKSITIPAQALVQNTQTTDSLRIDSALQKKSVASVIIGTERVPLMTPPTVPSVKTTTKESIAQIAKRDTITKAVPLSQILDDECTTNFIPKLEKKDQPIGKMSRFSIPETDAAVNHQSRVLPISLPTPKKHVPSTRSTDTEAIPEGEMRQQKIACEIVQRECAQRIQLVIDLTRKDFAGLGKLRPKEEVEKELAEKRRLQTAKLAPHHTLQGRRYLTKQKRTKRKAFLKGAIGEVTKFAVTSAAIFGISFSVMNAPALSQLMMARIDPVASTEKQFALEKVAESSNMVEKAMPILPTAGMKRETHKTFPALAIRPAPLENRIVIPKMGQNIPIVGISPQSLLKSDWDQLEKDIQTGLKDGVVHYPGTAEPGQLGNVFITGHSSYYFWDGGKYKDVFARLHDLEVGDEFTIFWEQDIYKYRIRERKVVPPEETSVLKQPTNEKIATLMTCTPIGTAKDRLILVAEQLN